MKSKYKVVEADAGLWTVWSFGEMVGAIFDYGSKVAEEKATRYGAMAGWSNYGGNEVIGDGKTWQGALGILIRWHKGGRKVG